MPAGKTVYISHGNGKPESKGIADNEKNEQFYCLLVRDSILADESIIKKISDYSDNFKKEPSYYLVMPEI